MSFVLLGAALVTLIVFFVFFRPSAETQAEKAGFTMELESLEKRMQLLEGLAKEKINGTDVSQRAKDQSSSLNSYKSRVERVEAALSVKFDVLTKRVGKLENSIAKLETTIKQMSEAKAAGTGAETKEKEAAASAGGSDAGTRTLKLHTVQKGDTLYSISKRYNTTISILRKLNNMTKSSKLYPGNTIIINQ